MHLGFSVLVPMGCVVPLDLGQPWVQVVEQECGRA